MPGEYQAPSKSTYPVDQVPIAPGTLSAAVYRGRLQRALADPGLDRLVSDVRLFFAVRSFTTAVRAAMYDFVTDIPGLPDIDWQDIRSCVAVLVPLGPGLLGTMFATHRISRFRHVWSQMVDSAEWPAWGPEESPSVPLIGCGGHALLLPAPPGPAVRVASEEHEVDDGESSDGCQVDDVEAVARSAARMETGRVLSSTAPHMARAVYGTAAAATQQTLQEAGPAIGNHAAACAHAVLQAAAPAVSEHARLEAHRAVYSAAPAIASHAAEAARAEIREAAPGLTSHAAAVADAVSRQMAQAYGASLQNYIDAAVAQALQQHAAVAAQLRPPVPPGPVGPRPPAPCPLPRGAAPAPSIPQARVRRDASPPPSPSDRRRRRSPSPSWGEDTEDEDTSVRSGLDSEVLRRLDSGHTGKVVDLRRKAALLQGRGTLGAWRAAGVGSSASAIAALRQTWQHHVLANLSEERDRVQAGLSLERAVLFLEEGARAPRLQDQLGLDVTYYALLAQYGVQVAAGVVRSYETDDLAPELRRRLQVQLLSSKGAASTSAARAAARAAGIPLPRESDITEAETAALIRNAERPKAPQGKGMAAAPGQGRRRGRGGEKSGDAKERGPK